MCRWLKRAFREFGIVRSEAKQHGVLYVKKWLVRRNPALLASVDSAQGDYSIFKDVLVLTETAEAIRVVIKEQEFWLPKSQIRIE